MTSKIILIVRRNKGNIALCIFVWNSCFSKLTWLPPSVSCGWISAEHEGKSWSSLVQQKTISAISLVIFSCIMYGLVYTWYTGVLNELLTYLIVSVYMNLYIDWVVFFVFTYSHIFIFVFCVSLELLMVISGFSGFSGKCSKPDSHLLWFSLKCKTYMHMNLSIACLIHINSEVNDGRCNWWYN